MSARPWWNECSIDSPIYNFVWKPFSHGMNFNEFVYSTFPKVGNHLEMHKEISKKSNLLMNLQKYTEVSYNLKHRAIVRMYLI